MELKSVRKKENIIEFEIKGEDHTFLGILREALNDQEGVTFAAYRNPHPILSNPIFHLRTNGISAVEAIEKAADKIISQCDELEKLINDNF